MTVSYLPLQLGPLRIDFPVVQAALSGYSDWPMRVIAKRLGAPFTICEVMLDQFVLNVTKGNKAKRFPPAAIKLFESGFDVIDINFGCPVKKVLGRCRGGYLLSQPEIALDIVGRVRDALPAHVPLTVKMRRGMDDSRQSRDKFFSILDGAYRIGVAAITVHGRTVVQRYQGKSSWDFIREVKQYAGDRVVLGSGDLCTARDSLEMF